MAEICAGRGGGSDWTASALLVNTITFRTHSNSKTCANTLIYDFVQLILSCSDSRMPGSWALTRILTNSHIFASSAPIAIIFTYLETPPSHLSFYVHYILLCQLPLMGAWLCVALLVRALTNLQLFVLLRTSRKRNNTLPTPRQRHFRSLATM